MIRNNFCSKHEYVLCIIFLCIIDQIIIYDLTHQNGLSYDVGCEDEQFTTELHHGGFFSGVGSSRIYLDEKVDWFDYCDSDTWSSLWLDDFIEQLGYDMSEKAKVYWLLPGKTFSDGLRRINSDASTNSMVVLAPRFRTLLLYVDHQDILESINWDDVALSTPASIPIVASRERSTMNRKDSDVKPIEGHDIDDDDDIDVDPDFVDSEYEADMGDEDVFDNCVEIEEVASSKMVVKLPEHDSDDEGLLLPESSDEDNEGIKLKFKNFVAAVDMESPIFKVGMLFSDAIEVRQAIKQYSVKNRVAIKFTRNTKKKIEAKCKEECSWMLDVAEDSRTNCLMVKRYIDGHKCQKEWELNYVTARYLANRYVEGFRDNDRMTLKSFSKVVQKELNVTPSRHKLGRARKLAMKAIYGDEIAQYDMLWDYGQELRTSNPGSKFFLNLQNMCFHTCYLSFDACKRGFLSGCRPIIFLDGCHIKTKFGGHLLTAVGINPNDCIYPIAMAIVEVESRASWGWFLNTLKEDLLIDNTGPYTIMTDRQKV